MYRLPTPFNSTVSNHSSSAAGGGSTSCTCSCCVISLGATAVATAAHFAGLSATYTPTAIPNYQTKQPENSTEQTQKPTRSNHSIINNKTIRALVGLFAIPACAAIAALAGNMAVGISIAIALWISIFWWVYQAQGRSPLHGAGFGILFVGALIGASIIEMVLWLFLVSIF